MLAEQKSLNRNVRNAPTKDHPRRACLNMGPRSWRRGPRKAKETVRMIRKAARSMLHISSSMDPSPPYHYSRTTTRSWYRPGPEGFARECCTHPFGPLASAPLAERVCSGQGTRPFAKGLKVRVPKGRKVHLALLAEGVSFGRRCAFQKRAPSPVRLCLMRQQKPGFPVREI